MIDTPGSGEEPGTVSAAEALRRTPVPGRIRALPRNKAGYPIPYFAATIDGVRDFRVGDAEAYRACVTRRICWICGQQRRVDQHAFVIGPMCAINRTSQDPPSHPDCAEYAAKVCPFMVRPTMARRERGLPENVGHDGIAIMRNPGVSLVWVTRTFQTFRPVVGSGYGVLFSFHDPTAVSWWACGRPATREEVLASIRSGLPLLEAECDRERDPAAARAELATRVRIAMRYLPSADGTVPSGARLAPTVGGNPLDLKRASAGLRPPPARRRPR